MPGEYDRTRGAGDFLNGAHALPSERAPELAEKSVGKKKSKAAKKEAPAPEATHNPFAALGSLRDALPSAPSAKTAKTAKTAKSVDVVASEVVGAVTPLTKVVLRREKKGRGGKTVTRVQGIPGGELDAWTKRAKKALGCGATVEEGELLLLGDLVERGAAFFEGEGVKRVVRGN